MPGRALLPPDTARATFTRSRVERIIGVVVGAACVIFGLQAYIAAMASTELGRWTSPVMWVVFGSLALMNLTAVWGKFPRSGAALFATVYLAVLLIWPLISTGESAVRGAHPWTWFLVNVATIASVLAFRLPWQIMYTAAIPVLYAVTRIVQGDGSGPYWVSVLSDLSFSLIFGFVLLLLGWTFRSVAASVDETRAEALSLYTRAAEAEALERERLEMAALMHDSVLSALIAGARADSPRQEELAVAQAREALTGLADAETDPDAVSDEPVGTAQIALDIEDAAVQAFGLRLFISPPADAPVPGTVARALTLAAMQAIANAVSHAEARGLSVAVSSVNGGCAVIIRDSGPGMDIAAVPDDRLGIRASIFARMSAVGGTATLDSGPDGTTVTIGWTP